MSSAPELTNFIRTVESIAHANCAHHVELITIELGASCSISPDYFYDIFHEASQNTIMENAVLVFHESSDPSDEHTNDVVLWGLEFS